MCVCVFVCVDHVAVYLGNETQVKRGRRCTLPHHKGKNWGGMVCITNSETDEIEEGSEKGSVLLGRGEVICY